MDTFTLFLTRILNIGRFRILVLLWVLCAVSYSLNAQQIEINSNAQSLNDILVDLHKNYNIESSYNHKLVSKCIISVQETYVSPKDAIAKLVKKCNFSYEYSDGVFVIYQEKKPEIDTKTNQLNYTYSGQVVDQRSKEPLPYSGIEIDGKQMTTDANGYYAIKSQQRTQNLSISYLGYYSRDTILASGINQKIALTPSFIGLKGVMVSSLDMDKISDTHVGEKVGLMKFNHKLTSFIPGNNNNTLFNLLRLQPGILAAAERNSSYSVWGSYRGQTLLEYDGIPIFSASSLSSEIGAVNPMMIKDIEVHKAGYNVEHGDRVGGVINMTGNFGDTEKFTSNINLNSQTVSGKINIPIARQYALQAAFRQSYYNVIDWNEILDNTQNNGRNYYTPDFTFQDMNLKFSHKLRNGSDFYITFLANNETAESTLPPMIPNNVQSWTNSTKKYQIGASAHYHKNWDNIGVTSLSVVYSKMTDSSVDNVESNRRNQRGNTPESNTYYLQNEIEEQSVNINHRLPLIKNNDINIGVKLISNTTRFTSDFVTENQDEINRATRLNAYLRDNISLGKYIGVQPGIKFDYLLRSNTSYLLPRINGYIKPHRYWQINMAWGMYNQYIDEKSYLDELNNRHYAWQLTDNKDYAAVVSQHYVLGVSYDYKKLKLSTEGFYKTTDGLSRILRDRGTIDNGQAISLGMDFYAKKRIKNHDFWMSYTISRIQQRYGNKIEYQRAPHDQTHEVKIATLLNFGHWHFSANYIYGSGLAFSENSELNDIIPYHRVDIGLLYRLVIKNMNIETGLSIVNLTNARNIAYSDFSNLSDGQRIFSRATPFTPSIFFNIKF